MDIQPYIVYVRTDDAGRITAINSSAFLSDASSWVQIDNGYGDKYHHAQGNYFTKPIMDDRGIYRYKLVNDKPIERTQQEMEADYVSPEIVPTQLDRIEAQVAYTAMITDTLLEV